jgi:hypothetical protein
MRGLNWQPLQLPLAAGLNQKTDERALQPPELLEAIDVQFDEVGGLQTRKPYSLVGSTIAGSGTISTARRIVANGNELVMFTKDSVYSWNSDASRWVFRATHLAISSEERTKFATPGDQYDCDRAELSGIVFTAWTDTDRVYMSAEDKATGAVLLAGVGVSGTATRPRLVAVSSRVLLFCHEGTDSVVGNITVRAFDPAETNPSVWNAALAAGGVTVLAAASCGARFDVTRVLGGSSVFFAARRAVTTSYEIATVTDASTPVVTASTKARTCDGPIAVASHPLGTHVQVVRGNGTNIQGDYILLNLTDVTTGQAVGTVSSGPVDHITAAYRSTQDSSQYRCYAFWTHDQETGAGGWECKSNYVDTGGTIGSEANFILKLGIGSRAFDHDGRVFFWGVFAGESSFSGASPSKFRATLQNTYFLYRDDATLHAKCAAGRGGGLKLSLGHLPGVALTSGTTVYSWAATERRIINIGSGGEQKGFDKRAPRDVTFTFDSNAARRCAPLGETLYVTGSEVLQYDGVGLYEVGFHVFPWYFGIVEVAAGNLADGVYTYKVTWRWENARGESDRSTTATHGDVTIAAGPNGGSIVSWPPLYITRKTTAKPPSVEVWRTAVNPPEGAPFYLVTSKDPSSLTNPNRYVPNDTTASSLPTFNDEFADSTATTKETNPENGDVLENLVAPGASIIAATDTRIFLAGVAGDPDRVWYSKLRRDGEVVSFHDALTFDVPKDGGAITGLSFQNGNVVVFREYATYMFQGDGYDNTSRGSNYGPPQVVSSDVGCRDTDSIAVTPMGIVFQSSKGKYLLNRGWTMTPIGQAVTDYDSETVLAAHVVPAQHQVRFVTGSRVLVWDYLDGSQPKWAEWTIASAVHACIWNGTYHYLAAAGPYAEQTTYSATSYGIDVETAWIKPNDLQGAVGVRQVQLLGEARSACALFIRVAYDYKDTWVDSEYWVLVPATAGLPMQHRVYMSRRKCQAFKLRVKAVGTLTQATLATVGDLVPVRHAGVADVWAATLTAIPLATLGNLGTAGGGIAVNWGGIVTAGATSTITVRDHWKFDTATGAWVEAPDIVGVKVETATSTTTVLVSAIEAAINLDSELLDVSTPHATAGATFQISDLGGGNVETSILSGGAAAAATGESIKLTGLAMEVGIEPKLHTRYPRT